MQPHQATRPHQAIACPASPTATARHPTRRQFIRQAAITSGVLASGAMSAGTVAGGYWANPQPIAQDSSASPNSRPRIGAIGLRYQGTVITEKAKQYGDVVALCDVDRHVLDQARASFGSTARIFGDYQDLISRDDVDVVLIGAPDHWHSKMLIDACRAGKDVYCEKPLTLTIDEGKVIRRVVEETGRVVQVGSWQRSDSRFRLAVEMVRQGRLGQLQSVDVVLGKNVQGGPFPVRAVPPNFDWERWQGQTPDRPYIAERSHYTFRWWYAYSGGQMTDWGAHHLDIAQWAIDEYPQRVEAQAKYPQVDEASYDVAIDYQAQYTYPSGVVLTVGDTGRNGIMLTGSEGRIFVNRGTISGAPVDALATRPLTRENFQVYDRDNLQRPERAGKLDAIINHMGNFFDCLATRQQPISDIESQHRSATTCHLGNIAMRAGRPLTWNAESETFGDDQEANEHLSREQRAGYEVV
ncbi:Gfo/Idh/MocA family protein [Planctomycetaceae bacterium SH139]